LIFTGHYYTDLAGWNY